MGKNDWHGATRSVVNLPNSRLMTRTRYVKKKPVTKRWKVKLPAKKKRRLKYNVTKTKTKTRKKSKDQDAGLQKGFQSNFARIWFRKRLAHKQIGHFNLLTSAAGQMQNLEGQQSVQTFFTVANASQCLTDTAIGTSGQNYDTLNKSLFNLNPAGNTGGASDAVIPASTTLADDRIILKSVSLKFAFASAATTEQEIILYIGIYKKTTTGNPFSLWNQGYVNQGLSTSVEGRNTGLLAGSNNATWGYPTNNDWSRTPYESKVFRDYINIKYRKSIQLSGGAQTFHTVQMYVNELLEKQKIVQEPATYRKGTICVFAVQKPGLVSDNTATNQFRSTYGICRMNWACQIQYKMANVPNAAARLKYDTTIQYFQTGNLTAPAAGVSGTVVGSGAEVSTVDTIINEFLS